jgi:hypothetical protein
MSTIVGFVVHMEHTSYSRTMDRNHQRHQQFPHSPSVTYVAACSHVRTLQSIQQLMRGK